MRYTLLGGSGKPGQEINKVATPENPGVFFFGSKGEFMSNALFCKKFVDRKTATDKRISLTHAQMNIKKRVLKIVWRSGKPCKKFGRIAEEGGTPHADG